MHKKRGEQVSESLAPQRLSTEKTCVSLYTRLAFKLPHKNPTEKGDKFL